MNASNLIDDKARNALVRYVPGFLNEQESRELFLALMTQASFSQEKVWVYGSWHVVKRQSCAFGEPGVTYSYAGVQRQALPWLPCLRSIRDKLEGLFCDPYNFVLCNLYTDGSAALGWHSDNESEIKDGSSIASISLGAERDFDFRLGTSGPVIARKKLASGDLIVMEGDTQKHYQHQVPTRLKVKEPRINLTFRYLENR